MSVDSFFATVLVTFLVAVGGVVVGLVQAWPKGGRSWDWKWALLFTPSAAVAGYVIAWYIAFVLFD